MGMKKMFKRFFSLLQGKQEAQEAASLSADSLNAQSGAHSDAQLRVFEAMFAQAQPVMVTDAGAHIQRVNPALCTLMGYEAQEMLGRTPKMFRSSHHDQAFYDRMVRTIGETGHWEGEIWDRRKSGEVFPKWMSIRAVKDAAGQVHNMVACYTDLSGQQHAKETIHQLAFYDVLTGLPNRALLRDRLRQIQHDCVQQARQAALFFLDWDDFKVVNDSQGYPAGDAFLRLLGERICAALPAAAVVARLGGDEFAMVLPALGGDAEQIAAQVETTAERLLQALAAPAQVGELNYQGSASLGIVLMTADSPDADSLLKQSEMAMYQAKGEGRGGLHFFDPELERRVSERLRLEQELRAAIAQGELVLHYQPQVRVDAQGCFMVTGAEALVRWQHPGRGLLGPGVFIPLAEQSGLIVALGDWVLRAACQQLREWQAHPERKQWILAVNVSAAQFVQPGFASELCALLQSAELPPEHLKLELTESLLVDQPEVVIDTMERLRAKGVRFSLDDFGTGYSSLAYLKRLPLNQLKIDQSFVRDLEHDPNDAAIARSVAALAQGLGLAVIAEGVETQAQQRMLQAMGCQHYQGYWFSKPLPLADFEAWSTGKIG